MSVESQATKELAHEVKELRRVLTALNQNLVAMEQGRRADKAASEQDPQALVKKAFQRLGMTHMFCSICINHVCAVQEDRDSWFSPICACCKNNHDLIGLP